MSHSEKKSENIVLYRSAHRYVKVHYSENDNTGLSLLKIL